MNENGKKKWGGARAGSGRKKTTAKTYTFNAPEDVMEIMETIKNGKTDFICNAIRHYAKELNLNV